MFNRILLFSALCLFIQSCEEKADPRPLNAEYLPANAKPIEVTLNTFNCWIEKERFCITGVCANTTADWQKIWLDATPQNASGKPLTIAKHASAIVSTFSDAVPPYGRTSFFASWPLKDISGKPDTCSLQVAGAVVQPAGPILVASAVNAVNMVAPVQAGQTSSPQGLGWQVSGSIVNALDMAAPRPRLEVLIFGADNRLWLSTLVNPEDPAVKPIFHFEHEGPFQPNESRYFFLQIGYMALPMALQTAGIGHVEVLPFEAR